MQISKVQSQNQSFKGMNTMSNKAANVVVNGAGSGIGKNYFRQYLLAKFAPKGVWAKWDKLKGIYANQNVIGMNMGSMGMKKGHIADASDEAILNTFRHGNNLGDLPDSIKLGVRRAGAKTETEDTREVFLTAESEHGQMEEFKLEATYDTLNWTKYDPKTLIFLDSTGKNTSVEKLTAAAAGAAYAILSAPAKDDMLTVVPGINNADLDAIESKGNVVSAASCTTTCISPYIKLMEDKFGIESGFIDTTHAATASQNIHDKADAKSESKNRGSMDAMIPTTTGAAKAIGKVIKHEDGSKIPLDGLATRVPTGNGSMAIITLVLKNKTTVDEVKDILKEAEKDSAYENLIASAGKGSTSKDVLGRIESGLYVPEAIKVTNGNLLTMKVYYDNEFGYTRSYATLASKVADRALANA